MLFVIISFHLPVDMCRNHSHVLQNFWKGVWMKGFFDRWLCHRANRALPLTVLCHDHAKLRIVGFTFFFSLSLKGNDDDTEVVKYQHFVAKKICIINENVLHLPHLTTTCWAFLLSISQLFVEINWWHVVVAYCYKQAKKHSNFNAARCTWMTKY